MGLLNHSSMSHYVSFLGFLFIEVLFSKIFKMNHFNFDSLLNEHILKAVCPFLPVEVCRTFFFQLNSQTIAMVMSTSRSMFEFCKTLPIWHIEVVKVCKYIVLNVLAPWI